MPFRDVRKFTRCVPRQMGGAGGGFGTASAEPNLGIFAHDIHERLPNSTLIPHHHHSEPGCGSRPGSGPALNGCVPRYVGLGLEGKGFEALRTKSHSAEGEYGIHSPNP